MMQIVLVGIGAGVASGLLFASVASGSLLSVVLFYLAPLPMMIAATFTVVPRNIHEESLSYASMDEWLIGLDPGLLECAEF